MSMKNVFINHLTIENIKEYFEHTTEIFKNYYKKNIKLYYNRDFNIHLICDGSKPDRFIGYETGLWFYNRDVMINNKWFKEFQKLAEFIIGGKHEGLCISYDVCYNMFNYLNENTDIENSIYETNTCVEEVAIQTLTIICKDKNYNSYTFIPSLRKIERNIETIKNHNKKMIKI